MRYINSQVKDRIMAADGGTTVLLEAPTGSGKTTFVLNGLLNHCKAEGKMMLCILNRTALKGQVQRSLLKHYGLKRFPYAFDDTNPIAMDSIVVCSYQYIQKLIESHHYKVSDIEFGKFDYVVADEIHYLIKDSLYVSETYYLKNIRKLFYNAVRIYISATMGAVTATIFQIEKIRDLALECEDIYSGNVKSEGRYIDGGELLDSLTGAYRERNVLVIDEVKADYSYIRPRYISIGEDIAEIIIKRDSEGDHGKWLVFVDSKEEGERIVKTLNAQGIKSSFIYSGTRESDGCVEMESLIKKRKFESRVLCCTNVIDNGVSIEDTEVTHIVINAYESIQAVQQLGRIRRTKNAYTLEAYFCRYSCAYFNQKKFPLSQKLKRYYIYRKGDKDEIIKFLDENPQVKGDGLGIKNRYNIWLPNKFCEASLKYHIEELKDNMERMEEDGNGFLKKSLSWFGLQYSCDFDDEIKKREEARQELSTYLESIRDIKHDKEKWEVIKTRVRLLYETATGECLCSGRKDRSPGTAAIKKVLSSLGFVFECKRGVYLVRREA